MPSANDPLSVLTTYPDDREPIDETEYRESDDGRPRLYGGFIAGHDRANHYTLVLPVVIMANSKEAALGKLLERAREEWPDTSHLYHSADVVVVPERIVTLVPYVDTDEKE